MSNYLSARRRRLTARATMPVTTPVFSATVRYGAVKIKLVADGGFRPFFRYPICRLGAIVRLKTVLQ